LQDFILDWVIEKIWQVTPQGLASKCRCVCSVTRFHIQRPIVLMREHALKSFKQQRKRMSLSCQNLVYQEIIIFPPSMEDFGISVIFVIICLSVSIYISVCLSLCLFLSLYLSIYTTGQKF